MQHMCNLRFHGGLVFGHAQQVCNPVCSLLCCLQTGIFLHAQPQFGVSLSSEPLTENQA